MKSIAKRMQRTPMAAATGTVKRIPRTPKLDAPTVYGATPGVRAKFKRTYVDGYEYYEVIWVAPIELENRYGQRVGKKFRRTWSPVDLKHGPWERLN